MTSTHLKQAPLAALDNLLLSVSDKVELELGRALSVKDEQRLDNAWLKAAGHVREFALRPAKRLRPAMFIAGYQMGGAEVLPGHWRFAAALEVLHTFLLVHDDVADRSPLRRGGPTLHHLLAAGRAGEDLAIVAGDHLFARAMEMMLESAVPMAARAVHYQLGICRHTAVGQYLDLELAGAPLSEVTLFQTLKVAQLKTARYGFVAPLVMGGMLAHLGEAELATLERVGRNVGLAYQLRDDLIGIFGNPKRSGKSADSDLAEGKRTFPVVAAYLRAGPVQRAELEAVICGSPDAESVARARGLIEKTGGLRATERVIDRATRAARRALAALPTGSDTPALLDQLLTRLERRDH